jgi:hypothetical protein
MVSLFTKLWILLLLELFHREIYIHIYSPTLSSRSLFQKGVVYGVGVRLSADGQSTSSSWYQAFLWGPWPDIIFLIFSFDNYFVVVPRAPSLTRGRDCSLQCNRWLSGHWGPITIHYRLIWDCVPFLSPLTTRRDYGGGILTRPHTGKRRLEIHAALKYTAPSRRHFTVIVTVK